MANALAIAAVTATLKDLLSDGVFDGDLNVLGEVQVSSQPPDTLISDQERNALNIFPWKVTHNAALSNMDMPSHSHGGQRVSRNRLALDIHYILTATGSSDLNAPILMGFGMQQLHENPVLTRAAIRRSLGGATPNVTGTILPADYKMLVASDLADQIESIRLVPAKTEDDELSKIWPAFNAALRMSSLYKVSVVLIEAQTRVKPALPVRTVGLRVNPMLRPRISAVHAQEGDRDSPAAPQPVPMGGRLMIMGSGLASDHVKVRVGTAELQPVVVQADPQTDSVFPEQISIRLPQSQGGNPIAMTAGVQSVVVEHLFDSDPNPGGQRTREVSPPAAVVIAPDIGSITSSLAASATTGRFSGTIDVALTHQVGAVQSVQLFLNPLPGTGTTTAFSIDAETRAGTGSGLRFPADDLPPGAYLYRLSIDGAETTLDVSPSSTTGAFDSPQLTLPAAP